MSSNSNWRSITWWFRDSSTGKVVLFQPPNASMAVAQAAGGLRAAGILSSRERELGWIRSAGLVVWALDEVFRGTTPFRRVIGAATLGWQVRKLVR